MMNEKVDLDSLLKEVDPNCKLDEDQKKVILSDEDYCMVVAGAGSGKTTTIAAKIRYLVKHEKVDANHILVLSFARKAFAELKERIEKYGVTVAKPNEAVKGSNGTTQSQQGVNVYTFHALGHSLIKDASPKVAPAVLSPARIDEWIAEIFRDSIMKDKSWLKKIIFFFSDYLNAPDEAFFWEAANGDREKLRGRDISYDDNPPQKGYHITIKGDRVKSKEEKMIANFLFENGIPYEYEPVYPYGSPGENNKNPYIPDFLLKRDGSDVYFEHFGVSESGKNKIYDSENEDIYNRHIEDKIKLHKENGTELLWTYSEYNDEELFLIHLEQELIKKGFQFCPPSKEKILDEKIERMQDQYEIKMIDLITQFISDFKTNRCDWDKITQTYQNGVLNDRSKLFLEICHKCYTEYEKRRVEERRIDFADMINQAVDILCNTKNGCGAKKLEYKYVFVDEFQDISRQRFDFLKAISDVTNAKITVVGDDWQSIYAFAGSVINSFEKFNAEMSNVEVLTLEHTYRNSQELLDVAGNFIQKNSSQFSKSLQSPKHLESPIRIYTYSIDLESGDRRTQEDPAIASAVEDVLKNIKSERGEESGRILLLGRYKFDRDAILESPRFFWEGGTLRNRECPGLELEFMTVHEAKGLGYDEVILLNGRDDTFGFPSQILNDPVLELIPSGDGPTDSEDEIVDFPEERRLFYVALTRTKNRVYIVAPEDKPSYFLRELYNHDRAQEKISGEQNVVLEGGWSPHGSVEETHKCPLCGSILFNKPKIERHYGKDIFVCSNKATNCDFITNDIRGKKMEITKCPDCDDGYMFVKYDSEKKECLLECQNHRTKGCKGSISMKQFYEDKGYTYPEDDRVISRKTDE